MTYRNTFFNAFTILLVICGIAGLTPAADQVQSMEQSTIKSYMATENTILKKRVLQTLSEGFNSEVDVAEHWKVDFLRDVLKERSPVLVEAAAHQIGALHIKDLNADLITLFHAAEQKYMGYSERVQIALVQTLGKTGGNEAVKLFSDFLNTDNGSYLGYEVLAAIAELNNPVLVTNLHAYAEKMKKRIAECKAQNKDPIFYSKFRRLKNLATDTENSLLRVKEGGDEK